MTLCTQCTDPSTCKTRQDTRLAQLSGLKSIMLASSVQAVVACNATALRVCTLVLFVRDMSPFFSTHCTCIP